MIIANQVAEDRVAALRERREELGWSQQEAVERTNRRGGKLTQAMLSRWERGKSKPREGNKTFRLLAEVLREGEGDRDQNEDAATKPTVGGEEATPPVSKPDTIRRAPKSSHELAATEVRAVAPTNIWDVSRDEPIFGSVDDPREYYVRPLFRFPPWRALALILGLVVAGPILVHNLPEGALKLFNKIPHLPSVANWIGTNIPAIPHPHNIANWLGVNTPDPIGLFLDLAVGLGLAAWGLFGALRFIKPKPGEQLIIKRRDRLIATRDVDRGTLIKKRGDQSIYGLVNTTTKRRKVLLPQTGDSKQATLSADMTFRVVDGVAYCLAGGNDRALRELYNQIEAAANDVDFDKQLLEESIIGVKRKQKGGASRRRKEQTVASRAEHSLGVRIQKFKVEMLRPNQDDPSNDRPIPAIEYKPASQLSDPPTDETHSFRDKDGGLAKLA